MCLSGHLTFLLSRYQCGEYKIFRDGSDNSLNLYMNKSFTCQWNTSWTPEITELDECVWTRCADFLEPPRYSNLKRNTRQSTEL